MVSLAMNMKLHGVKVHIQKPRVGQWPSSLNSCRHHSTAISLARSRDWPVFVQGPHHVDFVKVSKSGGVVTRQPPYRKSARISRVKEYFYGVKEDLNPISMTMKMDNLQIYKVGGGPKAPTSALPIGASAVADPLRITKVTSCSEVLHCLLAVSHADDPEQLPSVNVAGFLYVTDVDIKQNQITYLQPCPGPLPGKFLMMGSFQVYFE